MIRNLLIALATGAALAAPAHAWWNDSWTTRTRVVLDTTPAGLALPAAQTDVVVPVRLHSGNFDFALARPDGSDLRVVGADDKTLLPFEVERFDTVNELAVLWVRLPTVAQGSDKNLVHVYAGNDQAGAEAPAKVFATGYAAVLHFSEPDGPAQDAAAALKTTQAVVRETNGLMAGSARMDGTALSLPLGSALKLDAGSALTVAMWVKPDAAAESSTLLALGPVRLLRTTDQLEAQVDGRKLSGAALPASTWTHVALTVGAGKAVLYINGKPVGQADALLPGGEAALEIGAGYKGLLDELQVLPAARDEAWVRLAAAAQGGEGAFVKSYKEASGEPAAEGGEGGGYFGVLLNNLTTDAWVVIIILLVMFAIAVWVMVTKAMMVTRIGRANAAFIERFRADLSGAALGHSKDFGDSSLYQLYTVGQAEVAKRHASGKTSLSGASLDAIKATLDAVQVRQNSLLNARMVLLTIAISGGPFLGLLGTVVGVMITFAAIAAAGDVNVNAIAPGIAAALLATVAGLGVAIPALFGYNWLASQIKNISAEMQIFVDEFVTRAAELDEPR
jgi:biopolymer transport protein ExbB